MRRKNKIIIIVTIVCVLALTIGLIAGSLDRLDFEDYGLNYNRITGNFSDDYVYESGLHLIGFSNLLLEVPKTERQITINSIKTYTNDFFSLEVSAEISYSLVIPASNNFTFLTDFYIHFGKDPEKILSPLIKNSIIKVVSNYSSTDYQTLAGLSSVLEANIKEEIEEKISIWTHMDVSVLLSQLVTKGVSQNTESLDRKITGLISKAQRMQARKTDLTPLINTFVSSLQLQAEIIYESVMSRLTAVITLVNSDNFEAYELGKVLETSQAVGNNLSLSSLELRMRQEQYLLNDTSSYY